MGEGTGRDGTEGDAAALRRALETVDAVAAQVTRTPHLDDLLPAVLGRLVEAVGADSGIIRLLDAEGCRLVPRAHLGFPEAYEQARAPIPVDENTISGRAIRTGQVQVVTSPQDLPGVSPAARAHGFVSFACAPLVADGRPLGTVGFGSRTPRHFGADARRLLTTVAHHLAMAVVRAQLFDTVARAKAEWQKLFDVMTEGIAICRADGRLGRVNRAFATLFEAAPAALVGSPCPLAAAHHGREEGPREAAGPRPGQHLVVTTLALPGFNGSRPSRLHVVRDTTAERAATAALRRQNLLLEEARAEAEAFGEIAHSIATSLRLEDVLERIVEAGRRVAGVEHCGVLLLAEGGTALRGAALSGSSAAAYRDLLCPLDGAYGAAVAVREARTISVEDFATESRLRTDVAGRFGVVSALFVPLLGSTGPVGAMVFARTTSRGPFPADGVRRAERLAAHAALAIENARLHRELAEHAARLEERVRQRTEALEAASRHKSDFLAHMSHELRTPLTAILGFSGMLLEGRGGDLTEKGRRYAGRIKGAGEHLLALINDVLDLSRVEAGRLELTRERVAVSAAVAGAIDLMRGMAAAHGVTLAAELPRDGLQVRADPVRLHQMITNLLSNAIKFTPAGGRVTVRALPRPGEGAAGPPGEQAEWVEIGVSDTGVGIAAADLERLFRPFEQLDNGLRRSHEGTGLGLALTRRLAELHGGTVRAESPGVGQGSTFTLRLPAAPAAAARSVALVEDDPCVLEMVAETLRRAGHAVSTAGSAAEGARLLRAGPDLLILDLGLPDRPGLDLLADLRADPAVRGVPVLAISGSTDATAEAIRAAGADEFLTKPFSPTILLDAVSRLLGLGSPAGHREPAPAGTRKG